MYCLPVRQAATGDFTRTGIHVTCHGKKMAPEQSTRALGSRWIATLLRRYRATIMVRHTPTRPSPAASPRRIRRKRVPGAGVLVGPSERATHRRTGRPQAPTVRAPDLTASKLMISGKSRAIDALGRPSLQSFRRGACVHEHRDVLVQLDSHPKDGAGLGGKSSAADAAANAIAARTCSTVRDGNALRMVSVESPSARLARTVRNVTRVPLKTVCVPQIFGSWAK